MSAAIILSINYYYLAVALLSLLLIAFVVYVRFGSPIVVVGEKKIRFVDLLIPDKIWTDSIKSVRLLERMPAVRRSHEMYASRYNPQPPKAGVHWAVKGVCQVYTDEGVKHAVSYARDYAKCCIEINTTGGLFYINYKNEQKTVKLYEKIVSTVAMVGDDELVFHNDRSGLVKVLLYLIIVIIAYVLSILL